MKVLTLQPNLVEQVRMAILAEIASGRLAAGARIIQEQIAQALGVSRQPVQQALLLLRNEGALRDAPGRGLIVAPLRADEVEHMYDVRAVIEGLAARLAAEHNAQRAAAEGPALIDAGRKAVAGGVLSKLVLADMRFHQFIYELSGNPLIAPAMAPHWTQTQRVMGEVLIKDETPGEIWDQHAAVLDAIARGRPDEAEKQARRHIVQAAHIMLARLRSAEASSQPSADTGVARTAVVEPLPASARSRAPVRARRRQA